MPRKNKHKQSFSISDSQNPSTKGNGLWMLIIAVFMLICLVAGLMTLQSTQFNRPTLANSTSEIYAEIPNPDEWLIPLPDVEGMEPQVAQLIQQTHDAVVADRSSAQTWAQYAKVLDAHQLHDFAIEGYQNALMLDPENIQFKYLQTIALEFQGKNLQRVVDQFKEIAAVMELYPPVHLRLGHALMKQGKNLQARDSYRYSVEQDESFAMGHRGLGQALLSMNDLAEAIQHLERATQLSPMDSVTYASLSQAYTRTGQKKKAKDAAEKAKKLQPDHSIPDTLRYEVDALAIDSSSCAFRADRFIQTGDYEQAAKEYTIIEKVFPNDPVVHTKLAKIYRLMKNNERAYQHLQKIIDTQKNNTGAYIQMAEFDMQDRKFDAAITHYQKALLIKPDQILWRSALATACARNQQHEQAITEFQKAQSLGSLSAQAFADWGTSYALNGDMENAIEQYNNAIEQNPELVETLFHLGLAYEQLGQFDKAIEAYSRAVEINPDHIAAEKLWALK